MKRTPLKRKAPLNRSSSLKAGSTQRLHPERPLAVWCELRLDGCHGRAVERHERKRRSQGGDGSEANTFDLCRNCHRWVHDHPAISYENGWLLKSWAGTETQVPLSASGIDAEATSGEIG